MIKSDFKPGVEMMNAYMRIIYYIMLKYDINGLLCKDRNAYFAWRWFISGAIYYTKQEMIEKLLELVNK